jgi:hypothetical protein
MHAARRRLDPRLDALQQRFRARVFLLDAGGLVLDARELIEPVAAAAPASRRG